MRERGVPFSDTSQRLPRFDLGELEWRCLGIVGSNQARVDTFLAIGPQGQSIQGNAFSRFPSHPLSMETFVHGFDLGSTSVAEEIRVDRVTIGRMPRRGEVKDFRYWTELGKGDNRGLVVGGERSYLSLRTGYRVGLAVWHRWKGHRRKGVKGIWSVRG